MNKNMIRQHFDVEVINLTGKSIHNLRLYHRFGDIIKDFGHMDISIKNEGSTTFAKFRTIINYNDKIYDSWYMTWENEDKKFELEHSEGIYENNITPLQKPEISDYLNLLQDPWETMFEKQNEEERKKYIEETFTTAKYVINRNFIAVYDIVKSMLSTGDKPFLKIPVLENDGVPFLKYNSNYTVKGITIVIGGNYVYYFHNKEYEIVKELLYKNKDKRPNLDELWKQDFCKKIKFNAIDEFQSYASLYEKNNDY